MSTLHHVARRRRAGLCVSVLFLVSIVACVDRAAVGPGDQRVFATLDAFVGAYWERPIPLQGTPPDRFSLIEVSLSPSDCGRCHIPQYEDWQTTLHAAAYSPGLSGQLVDHEARNYAFVRSCLACHAPLGEQSAWVPDAGGRLVRNPSFDAALQQKGLVCAACHLRGWQRYGPPRRDGSLDPAPPGTAHAGAIRSSYFEDPRFCGSCHQFAQPAPNGKSLQNTLVEWQQSRYAREGIVCQTCHMPDRRHLWRGIHDSAMVDSGVTIRWIEPTRGEIALRVTNTATGHRFPTYVTPKVQVVVELLDTARVPLAGAVSEGVIGRAVVSTSSGWVEQWDTRLPPDSSMAVSVPRQPAARFARGQVHVFPDGFYNTMFAGMLARSLSDTARVLITEAHRRTVESSYLLFDSTIALP